MPEGEPRPLETAGSSGSVPAGAPDQSGAQPRLPGFPTQEWVKGHKLGDRYVRIRPAPHGDEFVTRGPGLVEATERASAPHSRVGQLRARAKRILLGERLRTAEDINERLTKVKALAVLSSDAISSVAYGTEASLGILIVAGTAALGINLILGACIAALMIIVGVSYRQTVRAYPHGGGSYIVAHENLGALPGLVAAAALLIDYVLTVSVSVSSGVDAIVSALPSLAGIAVPLGVFFILLIMLVNLRGIRESGTIFAAPTYVFIASFLIMIGLGVARAILSPGGLLSNVSPAYAPAALGWSPAPLGVFLVLTAFASGCSAMTGVEAISNGVPAFKPPESSNAGRTLQVMITLLVVLFGGVTYLAWRFGIEPINATLPNYQTVDSQLAHLLFVGRFGWFYFVVQFATLLVLVLAANTSFADFPRLSSILAHDNYLPRLFALRGDRLAFTTGIIVLSALSALLLVVFQGSTDALINLYALGVFTAFTLSQSGMVVHWRRLRERAGAAWQRALVVNLLGATATGIVAVVIIVAKFDRGAWIVVILVPILVLAFRGIAHHYARVANEMEALTPVRAEDLHHIAVVPISVLNPPALQGLAYARSLTENVIALHISAGEKEDALLRAAWSQWVESRKDAWVQRAKARGVAVIAVPHLVIIESPYRLLISPLVTYIQALRQENPGVQVSVILPEFVPAHWWERLLHNQTALRLKFALYSQSDVIVTNIPYHLKP